MDVVIVSAGAVEMKTGSRLRRRNPEAEITVVESGKWISLSRCGLPYFLGVKSILIQPVPGLKPFRLFSL